jgi:hypothetical protein
LSESGFAGFSGFTGFAGFAGCCLMIVYGILVILFCLNQDIQDLRIFQDVVG